MGWGIAFLFTVKLSFNFTNALCYIGYLHCNNNVPTVDGVYICLRNYVSISCADLLMFNVGRC